MAFHRNNFAMKLQLLLILAALLAVSAEAQQAPIVGGAPTLGYVFDRGSHAVRPILGIPGAATVGRPLDLGFSIKDAVVSSEQGYAIVSAGTGVHLVRWNGGISTVNVAAVGSVGALYMSPRGTAAAILTDGWIGVLTGMRQGTPQVTGLPLNSQPVAAAVSDDGAYVLAAHSDGTTILLGRDGTQTSLATPGPISKVAFRPGSADALVASSDNRVWLVQQTPSSAAFTSIATTRDGVSNPVGLGFLPDGNHVVIASGTGSIQTVDVVTGLRSSVSCSCSPVQLERMATPGVFRLTEATAEPQYLFNGATGETFFVPAVHPERMADRRAGN
jgi:hypothetical protein